ncbi:MAG TPA: dihydrodipicolinate reductase C-terminal domain-containing protein [Bryobacterales bacterium]|nr:dihydrodipicolinate reductase C-terminal domain-containing protein [Bryobacterales bacterium]
MKLAIVGYGKMGKLVEPLAPQFGFEVALKLDIDNNLNGAGITRENFRSIDVAVEFSMPSVVVDNIERITALGVNMVVGTTGWFEELPRVRAAVERSGAGLVYSPNFSVGMQVFFKVVESAARALKNQEDYDAWGYEIHHKMKKDAPSGTLLKLSEVMKQAGYARPIDLASNRAGTVPGEHVIGFDSEADTITLTHTARSRLGFARGALQAARWIQGKTGVHEFGDVLFSGGSA